MDGSGTGRYTVSAHGGSTTLSTAVHELRSQSFKAAAQAFTSPRGPRAGGRFRPFLPTARQRTRRRERTTAPGVLRDRAASSFVLRRRSPWGTGWGGGAVPGAEAAGRRRGGGRAGGRGGGREGCPPPSAVRLTLRFWSGGQEAAGRARPLCWGRESLLCPVLLPPFLACRSWGRGEGQESSASFSRWVLGAVALAPGSRSPRAAKSASFLRRRRLRCLRPEA